MPRAAQIPVQKMTDADVNCFASELSSPSSSSASPRTPTKNVQLELEPTSPFVLRAPASAKSKLILQNMEEVLNTVKQKHREKHKRKREEKRRAAAEAAAAAAAASASPAMDEKTKSEKPQPLREKATQENGLSSSHSKSQLKKPNESASAGSTPTANPPIPSKPTNVFELMMKARNRSLGVNEGAAKELPLNDSECSEAAASPTLGKRKQLLQEWNDRKGGAKRRLADEQRGEFIGQQLEKRAKRFKKMLTQESPTAVVHATASAPPLPIAKRGRGRPRRRRLSSVDTEMQKEQEPEQSPIASTDPQTAEFLAKLSSPTKKRDSLLGYFAKVETPKNVSLNQAAASLETPPQETPKRRPRRTNNNNKLKHEAESSVVPFPEPTIPMPNLSTPSGRPRRSCANKARYDYDLETSPIKSNPVAKEDNSIEVIDLDTSNPPTTPKKLAPLFVKQLPKPSPDPSVLKARQDFLHSGVPERIRQEQSRLKQLEQQYDENYELFPRIAHVGCLDYKTLVVNLPKPWTWRQAKEDHDDQYDGNSIQSHARLCDPPPQQPATNQKQRPSYATLPSLDNKRSFVKLWKNEFDRFPTFKCYNQMREKYRHFSAMDSAQDTQQVGESFVVTRRSRRSLEQQQQQKQLQQQQQLDNMDEAKPPMGAPNGELLFTEKYKPLLFEQVLVNLTPVQELKEFLSSWCTAGGRKNSQDDFNYDTMDSSSCSMTSNSNSNTMVLVGPSSSGKTNAVFALANDLNFNVLEINAGMRRTGKKLMQELQEATQSHQIRKDNKSARGKGNSGNLLQKMQKSSISNDQSCGSNAASASGSSATAADVRKSLILIEDADIVFEQHDAGFTDAIYTLANSSKRPVIVVATNPNCAHLQRLMQQNCIHFHAPNALNISRFLAVLSLMENCPIELDELVSLYLYNAQNLRKTLMELQFYIQSGGDRNDSKALIKPHHNAKTKSPIKSPKLSTIDGSYIHQRLFEFYTCTQNIPNRIPFPLDFHLLRLNLGDLLKSSSALAPPSSSSAAGGASSTAAAAAAGETNRVKRKSRSPKKAWLINSANQKKQLITPLDTLASFYENLSIASQMNAHADHTDRLQSHLSEDISHLLVEQALLTGLAIRDDCPYNLFDKPTQRTTLCDQLGNYQLRTATTRSLDYEPALRSICRSERERSTQERRSSRFYHYLRNHLVNVTSFSMESCEAVCQVLQSTPSTNSSSIQKPTTSIETQSTNNS